ncbi:hypothetical protein IJG71_03515 [Candidatus Saccharibacteria bacterium]|nr:hypothetical protein [Candidatus Saccharibacteria bacterium]
MEKQKLIKHNLNIIKVERRIITAIHFLYGKREPHKIVPNKDDGIEYLYTALYELLLPPLTDEMIKIILNDASDAGCIFLLCKIPELQEDNRLLNEAKKNDNSEAEKTLQTAIKINISLIKSMLVAEKYSFSMQEKIERRMLLAIHYMKNKIPNSTPNLVEFFEEKLYNKLLPNLKQEDIQKILKSFDDITCLEYLNNFGV